MEGASSLEKPRLALIDWVLLSVRKAWFLAAAASGPAGARPSFVAFGTPQSTGEQAAAIGS